MFCRLGPFSKMTLLAIAEEDTWLLFIDQKSSNWDVQGNWQYGNLLGFVRLKGE